MDKFVICDGKEIADIVIEDSAFEGVKEIGKTVAEDISLVTGQNPRLVNKCADVSSSTVIFCATIGKSNYLRALELTGIINLSPIKNKREVFLMASLDEDALREAGVDKVNDKVKRAIVIAGSDKRGTIYGMFHLSELCGVSPLVYFGDAIPEKKDVLQIDICEEDNSVLNGISTRAYVSKEPSVYYRGFFINDEWPAFGNWATEKFGGVNAKCYRKIFELLLRMKGNYMWPAMWNSNFSEEGPGIENARLADELGVIMGTSHHEPLFRAGNEWQQQYKNYGEDNSWSFLSNEKAITKFWEDGVKRNKEFESVVTIGMRGEADSKLLPEDATMKDNIEVVKKAIIAQDKILKDQYKEDYDNLPRMLAIYKEVEDYYYGDETCQGLKDWDELENAIFLLSDDNHGNLRNLPTEAEREHAGGYGMYYHFDYHGAPISYEWTNCNRLTKTWEQMTTAYEAGVRKMWIVNVGDLKEMEYPLSFFMDLAYDYEAYGLNGLNKTTSYVYSWIDKQFGGRLSDSQKKDMYRVLEGYTRFNALRTPETMNELIYHPVHFRESERILSEVRDILDTADRLKAELNGEAFLIYESMVYYAAAASLNLIIAWILTGFNHELAKRGAVYANSFIPEIEERIALDKKLVKEFHEIIDGKWNHCLSSAHTGFRTWDDREWFYPSPVKVSPITGAKAIVSFRGYDRYHLGAHWQDMASIVSDDFVRTDAKEILLDIDSKGEVAFNYGITLEGDVLCCNNNRGRVSIENFGRSTVSIIPNLKLNNTGSKEVKGRVDISFDNGQKTFVDLLFIVGEASDDTNCERNIKSGRYISDNVPYVCIETANFVENKHVDEDGFEIVEHLGREKSAIKAFPPMKNYEMPEDNDMAHIPYVSYNINVKEAGEYDIIFYLMTRNPSYKGGRMKFYVAANEDKPKTLYSVSDHYYTEWQDEDWAQGVLRGGRCIETPLQLEKGTNELRIYAGDPGVILEKFVIKRKDFKLPDSYLGPVSNY